MDSMNISPFRDNILHGNLPQRKTILRIMQAALQAVDPYEAVRAHLHRSANGVRLGATDYPLRRGKVMVIGAGKAGGPMSLAVEEIVGDKIDDGAVIVKHGHTSPTERIKLYEAGHPLPDKAGVRATAEILRITSNLAPHDLVICLLSGGASALMVQPAEGVTLTDLQHTTDLLLRSGANIQEINTLRKHLSQVKGGRLARHVAPARIVSLVLSDVVGSPLDVIASGPTVPDPTTFAQALDTLQRYGLTSRVPRPVQAHLKRGLQGAVPETPKPGDPLFDRTRSIVVASNEVAARAARVQAQFEGFNVLLLSTFVEGEAREVAKVLAAMAREVRHSGQPIPAPACLIAGGETTVTIRGTGTGGRNQELALAAAIEIAGMEGVYIAALATDGTDGPTDTAGALVDGTTLSRGTAQGLDARSYLANNDSYRYFATLGDHIVTGPTRTNVNDLMLVLVFS